MRVVKRAEQEEAPFAVATNEIEPLVLGDFVQLFIDPFGGLASFHVTDP